MATDNSPVQNKIIIAVGLGAIVVLVGLKFVFDSYYSILTAETTKEKLAPPVQLAELRSAEVKALGAGAMPIDKAMGEIANRGRANVSPDLVPTQSEDMGPMVGWSKLGRTLPPRPTAMAATMGDAGASATGDAAAPLATDAAATPLVTDAAAGSTPTTTATDAGAAPAPPAPHTEHH